MQIVALGGGGTTEAVHGAVLALASRQPPRVLYVGTAGAEDPRTALTVYDRLRGKAEVSHLQFFPWPPADLRERTLAQDVIYVGGPFYRQAVDDGFPPGYAADAGVGLHFVGTELAEVLSPREAATAYRVEPGRETPLAARVIA